MSDTRDHTNTEMSSQSIANSVDFTVAHNESVNTTGTRDVNMVDQHDMWHFMSKEQVMNKLELNSLETGLLQVEAVSRLTKYGENTLAAKKSRIPLWLRILLRHIFTMMNFVLLFAAVLSGVVKDWVDFGVIWFVIITNVIVGFFQEYRAENTMAKLKSLTAPSSSVLRDGQVQEIPSSNIVPGDVVLLKEGDSVPVDLRIIQIFGDLECNEALLTGESVPVAKKVDAISPQSTPNNVTNTVDCTAANDGQEVVIIEDNDKVPTPTQEIDDKKRSKKNKKKKSTTATLSLGDRVNCAFMGTTVAKGRGSGIAVSTGMDTQIGQIAKSLSQGGEKKTPLQKKMTYMGLALVIVALIAIGVVLICVWQYQGKSSIFPDALVIGISIAVAIIPECLVAVITLTMTVGMRTMVKQHVIVRRLAALENLGNVHSVCSDKTGTLTEGKMSVTAFWTGAQEYSVSTDPSNPIEGEVYVARDDTTREALVDMPETVTKLITIASLCNSSNLYIQEDPVEEENKEKDSVKLNIEPLEPVWVSTGDPTEIALNGLSQKVNMKKSDLENNLYPNKLNEFPFDSTIKRMTVLYEQKDRPEIVVFTKGAPERVLDLCTHVLYDKEIVPFDTKNLKMTQQENEIMAERGLRVLSLAFKYMNPQEFNVEMKRDSIERDLVFVGLVGIQDPPRAEVPDAVAKCQKAGIVVRMLTGDHHVTAKAIAQQVGIIKQSDLHRPNVVMKATDFDALTDEELRAMDELPLVVARCSPQSKVKMVKALHDRKLLCAMTGDGVNDSPSIKDADIGIAMGKSGSDVTKEAADIILTDDNFTSITLAIIQGRRIFNNIRKFVIHLLSANVAQLLGLLIPVISGYQIPLNATQILWVNLVTSSPVAIALGVEKPSPYIMDAKKQKIGESIFHPENVLDIFFYGALLALILLINYFCMIKIWLNRSLESARAVTFTTMVILLLFHSYNCRNRRAPFFMDGAWRSYWLHLAVLIGIGLQAFILYVPKINTTIFHHAPLKGDEWAFVLVGLVVFMAGAELYKLTKRLTCYSTKKCVTVVRKEKKKKRSSPTTSVANQDVTQIEMPSIF